MERRFSTLPGCLIRAPVFDAASCTLLGGDALQSFSHRVGMHCEAARGHTNAFCKCRLSSDFEEFAPRTCFSDVRFKSFDIWSAMQFACHGVQRLHVHNESNFTWDNFVVFDFGDSNKANAGDRMNMAWQFCKGAASLLIIELADDIFEDCGWDWRWRSCATFTNLLVRYICSETELAYHGYAVPLQFSARSAEAALFGAAFHDSCSVPDLWQGVVLVNVGVCA